MVAVGAAGLDDRGDVVRTWPQIPEAGSVAGGGPADEVVGGTEPL